MCDPLCDLCTHFLCDHHQQEVPEAALQQLRDVAGGLSMCFRCGCKGVVVLCVLVVHGGGGKFECAVCELSSVR